MKTFIEKKDGIKVVDGLGSVNVKDFWCAPSNEGVDTDLYCFDCTSEKLDSFLIEAEVGKDLTELFKWLDDNEVYPSYYGHFGHEHNRDFSEDEIFTIDVFMHTRGYESVKVDGAYISCVA